MNVRIIKLIAIYLSLLVSTSKSQVVEVLMDIPKYIEPGKELPVNMLITRGSTRGFIKIEKYFPVGIIAEPIDVGNAEFSFNHNYLVIFWKEFPDKDEVEVKYNLKIPATIEGKGKIEGKVSYFEKGKMTDYAFEDLDVTFQKPESDDETDKTVETPLKVIVGAPTKTKGSIEKVAKSEPISFEAKRTISVTNENEMLVQINMLQKNLTGFLKVEESIPMGLKASMDGAGTSSFSFIDNKVKFVWSDAPKENQITVSYKLVRDGFNGTTLSLEGSANYLDNGETKKLELKDENIAWNFSTDKVVKKESAQTTTTKKKKGIDPEKSTATTPIKPVSSSTLNSTNRNNEKKSRKSGLEYRIQICATQNKTEANKVAAEFNVKEDLELEVQDGWYKYTIGNFENYSDAKNMLVAKTNLSTMPFIAAYFNGQRISIPEALKIQSQKLTK